jgi:hypothetical protein
MMEATPEAFEEEEALCDVGKESRGMPGGASTSSSIVFVGSLLEIDLVDGSCGGSESKS